MEISEPSATFSECGVEAACVLCGRIPRKGLTKHHLIPRCCHKNKWFKKRHERARMQQTIDVCRQCHDMVHRFIPSEKELGRSYASVGALKAHPELANYLEWMKR